MEHFVSKNDTQHSIDAPMRRAVLKYEVLITQETVALRATILEFFVLTQHSRNCCVARNNSRVLRSDSALKIAIIAGSGPHHQYLEVIIVRGLGKEGLK